MFAGRIQKPDHRWRSGHGEPASPARDPAATRLWQRLISRRFVRRSFRPRGDWRSLLALLASLTAGSTLPGGEDLAIPRELLGWDHEVSARVRGGFKDNVLLSSFTPEESAFLGAGLEWFVSRAFDERWSLEIFGDAEERHYFSADAVDDEQTALALVQVQRKWPDTWSFKGACEYLFQNQVVDVSATEPQFETLQVVGHAIVLRPAVRWTAGKHWLELQTPGQRQLYESPMDDSWQYGVRLQLGVLADTKMEHSLSYEFARNPFDTERDREPNALPIPGSERVMDQHDARFVWRQSWDQARRWQTTFRASLKAAVDNATGYYDYARGQFFLQLRFRDRNWEAAAEGRWGHYTYPVQTVSAEDATLRRRTEWVGGLHLERRLSRRFKVAAGYSYERTRGNRVGDDYSANTVSGGLNFTF